jgi:acyl dehydratase
VAGALMGPPRRKCSRPGRFDPERLGAWSEPGRFEVDPARVAAYAAATNDDVALYARGGLVPPVLAILPAIDVYPREVERLFGESLASLGSVHGEHDLLIERPLAPGMALTTRAAVVGVQVKPSGTAVVVRTESRDRRGSLVNTQYAVQFLRGFDAGASAGEVQPSSLARAASRSRAAVATVGYRVDLDQARRYAEASGDFGDYTLDDAAARKAGFPRPILHGACTMAFAGRAVVEARCGGDPPALRRLAVRFSAPCFPGDELTTTVWDVTGAGPRADTAFEVADQDGRTVISNGIAEVRR